MKKFLPLLLLGACGASQPTVSTPVRAAELAERFIIVDGHIDVPWRLWDSRNPKDGSYTEDISLATEKGEFDYPRAKKGGLDAPFMSIFVPSDFQPPRGGAKQMADLLIDMVEGFVTKAPDKFAIARTPDEVIANTRAGKISLPLGIENGAALEGKLKNVEHFYDRGVRYITLTHSKDNDICDSSFDKTGTHKGLSAFGKDVVKEMNRLGIMIDVSHISDRAFYQVMELTSVPVIASHSSLRHFVPDFERNMSDDMVKALAKNGGVIMINFGSTFLSKPINRARMARWEAGKAFAAKMKLDDDDPAVEEFLKEYDEEHGKMFASVETVADHIDHVVKLVGIDHVGFGSDFDGVGDTLPTGLKSVADYPNLIRVLLERGYKEEDIEKICSGNVFRVWRKVTEFAVASSGAGKSLTP
jgi:membrane dipeptidase